MEDPRSISISLSRNSILEGMSMYRASLDDAASRLADGADTPAISNEQICSGGKAGKAGGDGPESG